MYHQTALDLMRLINAKSSDPRLTVRIVQVNGHESVLRITHPSRKGHFIVRTPADATPFV